MRPVVAHACGLCLVLAFCTFFTGCNGVKTRITKENFDKIKNDMSFDDVEEILGRGTKVSDGSGTAAAVGIDINAGARPSSAEEYTWQSGKNTINVTFRKEKVVGKTSSGF